MRETIAPCEASLTFCMLMSGLDWGIARRFQLRAGCLPVNSLWADGDGERAFSAFLEEWAVGFLLVLGFVGVDELHIARAQDLETIVEVRSGSQRLGAEAGA